MLRSNLSLQGWDCKAHIQQLPAYCEQGKRSRPAGMPYLVVQIVVKVVAQQQVEQGLLPVLVMPQNGRPMQRQQMTAATKTENG